MPNQQPNFNQQFNQPFQPPIAPQKPKFNLTYILIVLGLAVIVGGGVLAYQYWWLPEHEIQPLPITITNPTANWQTYRNETHGYEFKYPQNIEIVEPGIGYALANENSNDILLDDKNISLMEESFYDNQVAFVKCQNHFLSF